MTTNTDPVRPNEWRDAIARHKPNFPEEVRGRLTLVEMQIESRFDFVEWIDGLYHRTGIHPKDVSAKCFNAGPDTDEAFYFALCEIWVEEGRKISELDPA